MTEPILGYTKNFFRNNLGIFLYSCLILLLCALPLGIWVEYRGIAKNNEYWKNLGKVNILEKDGNYYLVRPINGGRPIKVYNWFKTTTPMVGEIWTLKGEHNKFGATFDRFVRGTEDD